MIKHPKRRGEWVELQFMARAAAHGLTVCKPWGECTRYDFAVEHQGRFTRVQVKSTSNYFQNQYQCRCTPPTRPRGYRCYEIDFLAAYIVPEEVWYIIPVSVVSKLRRSISLAPHRVHKYNRYLEAWHLLRKSPDHPITRCS